MRHGSFASQQDSREKLLAFVVGFANREPQAPSRQYANVIFEASTVTKPD